MTTITLPTASAYAALPLSKRTALFGLWLKAQPRKGTYLFGDRHTCVLAQFSKALYSDEGGTGCVNDIGCGAQGRIDVMAGDCCDMSPATNAIAYGVTRPTQARIWSSDDVPITFGRASDAFQRAIKGRRYKAMAKAAA